MPEVPHIGLGFAGASSRNHDTRVNGSHPGHASVLERPASRDRVEISASAHRLERLVEAKEIRYDLVERIRQEIADGSYESEQRLADATDRLLAELDQ